MPHGQQPVSGSKAVGNEDTACLWMPGNYAGNFQVFGSPAAGNDVTKNMNSALKLSTVTDGASNTVFFAEKFRTCNQNSAPLLDHGRWNVSYMMIVVLKSIVAGCGGDAGYGANPGVPVEWDKSPDAPKCYADSSKSVSTGRPEKGGPMCK